MPCNTVSLLGMGKHWQLVAKPLTSPGVARLSSSRISHSLVISRMVIYFLNDNVGPESHWLQNYHVCLAVMLGFKLSGIFSSETSSE